MKKHLLYSISNVVTFTIGILMIVSCKEKGATVEFSCPVAYGMEWDADTVPGCDFAKVVNDSGYALSTTEMLGLHGNPTMVLKTHVGPGKKKYNELYFFTIDGNIQGYSIDHPQSSVTGMVPDIIAPKMQAVQGRYLGLTPTQYWTNPLREENYKKDFDPLFQFDVRDIPSYTAEVQDKNQQVSSFYLFYDGEGSRSGNMLEVATPYAVNVYQDQIVGYNASPDSRFNNYVVTGSKTVKVGTTARTGRLPIEYDINGNKVGAVIGNDTYTVSQSNGLIKKTNWDFLNGYANVTFNNQSGLAKVDSKDGTGGEFLYNKAGRLIKYGKSVLRYHKGFLVYMQEEPSNPDEPIQYFYRWSYDDKGRLVKCYDGYNDRETYYKYSGEDEHGNITKREEYVREGLQSDNNAPYQLMGVTKFRYSYDPSVLPINDFYVGHVSEDKAILALSEKDDEVKGYLEVANRQHSRFSLVGFKATDGYYVLDMYSDEGDKWGTLEIPNPSSAHLEGTVSVGNGDEHYTFTLGKPALISKKPLAMFDENGKLENGVYALTGTRDDGMAKDQVSYVITIIDGTIYVELNDGVTCSGKLSNRTLSFEAKSSEDGSGLSVELKAKDGKGIQWLGTEALYFSAGGGHGYDLNLKVEKADWLQDAN